MIQCPSCAQESPVGFQFCGFCGAPLVGRPASSTARERKVVSVLFCDLVGFTAASEDVDPEDVQTRIAGYHRSLRGELENFGGTVEKFIGDAVMAVFGAPVAHEDDAERAVRAGLGILEVIENLNAAAPGLRLQVRIGVNTGEAIVSLDVRPEHGEGIVAGDVVNTAARIQTAAPVGSLAVGPETYRQTERVFAYEALPPATLKGKAEPVSLYRALRARGRFGSDVTRTHEAPFVGREADLGFLKLALAKTLREAAPQVVTLVGEPGVGKSRLVAELSAYVDLQPEIIRWRQGRCLPYGEGVTFWALGELVKAHAGIYESDSPDVAESKLEAVLRAHDDRPWLKTRLLPLLGIDAGPAPAREESFLAWRRFLEDIAATRPAVLVVEDLHWADPALLEFLAYLAEWAEGVRLLLVCTARPELFEKHQGWGTGTRNATTISLAPLSDAETAQLIIGLTSTEVVTGELRQAILERAGGNPLYAEEFVRLLQDRGPRREGAGEPAFPDSLQALIAARLDTLHPERKILLQHAAVIGRTFWEDALGDLGSRDRAEVEQALHELSRKQLVRSVRASSMEGETEYAFWHVLVRDVAYRQIPRAERGALHRAVAAWLERKAGGRLEDLAELLAHHYLAALELANATGQGSQAEDLAVPARRFLVLAAERALALDAPRAEKWLSQALALTPPDHRDRPEILVRAADAAFHTGRLREAAAMLEEALADLRARGEDAAAAQALIVFSRVATVLAEGRQVALAAEAVTLLEGQPSAPALVDAHASVAVGQFIAGNRKEAIAAAERALELATTLELPEPAVALGLRGLARAVGDPSGIVEMERAMRLLLEQGATRDAAALQNNIALTRYPLEGPAATLKAFEQGITFCEQRGITEMMLESSCPGLLWELGRPDEALALADRVAAAAEAGGYRSALLEVRSIDVSIRAARGEPAAEHAEWLVEAARESGAAEEMVVGLGAAALLYSAAEKPERACPLLGELVRTPGALESPYYARQLPAMVRVALGADDPGLASRLIDGVQSVYPLHQHALHAARGAVAEAVGEPTAAEYYAEAAERWRQFGNVPERAEALLGQGRCLCAYDQRGARDPLRAAGDIFATLAYRPAMAAVQALLAEVAGAGRHAG